MFIILAWYDAGMPAVVLREGAVLCSHQPCIHVLTCRFSMFVTLELCGLI